MEGLQKWTSDSELYKAEPEMETSAEDNWKTLESKNRRSKWQQQLDQDSEHPLRRSRAQIQLSNQPSSGGIGIGIGIGSDGSTSSCTTCTSSSDSAGALAGRGDSCRLQPRATPNYSEHEMEDWILDGEHEPSPSESEEAACVTSAVLPAISENSYESDDERDDQDDQDDQEDQEEEEEEQLFIPAIYTPECDQVTLEKPLLIISIHPSAFWLLFGFFCDSFLAPFGSFLAPFWLLLD